MGRKVQDLLKLCECTGVSKFTSFLNLREAELALAEVNRQKWKYFCFFGGFETAERKMLGIFPDSETLSTEFEIIFPMVCLKIAPTTVGSKALTHRDYLGAILALGIQRHCIGDIIEDDVGVRVFVQSTIAPLLLEELTQVGRTSVQVTESSFSKELKEKDFFIEKGSVSSLRLDAVLSTIMHINRADVATMITKGLVQVNHLQVTSQHYSVCEGDIFSVRGTGKFKLQKIGGKSRKDRTFIEYLRY